MKELQVYPILTNLFWVFNITLILISSSGCQSTGTKDIRDYYYPLKKLTEGQVYAYRPVSNDSLNSIYWYYRSVLEPEHAYLTGTFYEYDLLPRQFIREEVVGNGVLLEELFLYSNDSLEQRRTAAKILAGSTFPFEVRDSGGIFLYKIQWNPIEAPESQITLIKNRRYIGDTTYVLNGERLDCVQFEVKELFEHVSEGSLEQEFSGVEIYAKGIGLIYYRKEIGEDFILAYELADRYPMAKLEEQFRQLYEQ